MTLTEVHARALVEATKAYRLNQSAAAWVQVCSVLNEIEGEVDTGRLIDSLNGLVIALRSNHTGLDRHRTADRIESILSLCGVTIIESK